VTQFARGVFAAFTLAGVVSFAKSDIEAVAYPETGGWITADADRSEKPAHGCHQLFAREAFLSAKPIDREFALLTWNIEKGQDASWIFDLTHHLPQSDILLFQEAALEVGQEQLSLPAKRNFAQYFAPGYQQGDPQTGVITASRWPAAGDCALTAREPWLGTPKATSIARFQVAPVESAQPAGDDGPDSEQDVFINRSTTEPLTLLIVNVHAINFALGLDAYTAQFEAIGRVTNDHRGPLIVGGDFNTWSKQRTEWLEKFLRNFGLAGVSFNPDYRTAIFSRPLDHLYVRGLEVQASKVLEVETSDHNPLWIRVKLHDI